MRANIKTRFATAKDTAEVLGVSRSRLQKLERLATTIAHSKKEGSGAVHVQYKVSNSKPGTTRRTRVVNRRRVSGKARKSTS